MSEEEKNLNPEDLEAVTGGIWEEIKNAASQSWAEKGRNETPWMENQKKS